MLIYLMSVPADGFIADRQGGFGRAPLSRAAGLEESPVGRTRGAAGFAPRALADVYA